MLMAEEEDVGEDIIYLLNKNWLWNIIGDAEDTEDTEDTEDVANIEEAEKSTVEEEEEVQSFFKNNFTFN